MRSRVLSYLVLSSVLLFGPKVATAAGGLYGTVRQVSPSGPAAGVELELSCPGSTTPDRSGSSHQSQTSGTRTDSQGAFTLRVPAMVKGRCELRVRGRGSPIEVFVSESSLKYDLDVDKAGNLKER